MSKPFFTNTLKTVSKYTNSTLNYIDRMGLITTVNAGVFMWNPHGLLIKNNISKIVKKHMNSIGEEVEAPNLVGIKIFEDSGRSDAFKKELFRFDNFCLAPTAEEIFAMCFSHTKHENKFLYQVSTKFRKEIRPRNLFLRSNIFTMKDGYSFSNNEQKSIEIYKKVKLKYFDLFEDLGIKTFLVSSNPASMCGLSSEEFFYESDIDESSAYFCETSNTFFDEYTSDRKKISGIEIGHIFNLGTHFTKNYKEKYMCSYGMGIDRLVFTVVDSAKKDSCGNIVLKIDTCPYHFGVVADDFNEKVFLNMPENISVSYADGSNIFQNMLSFEMIGVPFIIMIKNKEETFQISNRYLGKKEKFNISEYSSEFLINFYNKHSNF